MSGHQGRVIIKIEDTSDDRQHINDDHDSEFVESPNWKLHHSTETNNQVHETIARDDFDCVEQEETPMFPVGCEVLHFMEAGTRAMFGTVQAVCSHPVDTYFVQYKNSGTMMPALKQDLVFSQGTLVKYLENGVYCKGEVFSGELREGHVFYSLIDCETRCVFKDMPGTMVRCHRGGLDDEIFGRSVKQEPEAACLKRKTPSPRSLVSNEIPSPLAEYDFNQSTQRSHDASISTVGEVQLQDEGKDALKEVQEPEGDRLKRNSLSPPSLVPTEIPSSMAEYGSEQVTQRSYNDSSNSVIKENQLQDVDDDCSKEVQEPKGDCLQGKMVEYGSHQSTQSSYNSASVSIIKDSQLHDEDKDGLKEVEEPEGYCVKLQSKLSPSLLSNEISSPSAEYGSKQSNQASIPILEEGQLQDEGDDDGSEEAGELHSLRPLKKRRVPSHVATFTDDDCSLPEQANTVCDTTAAAPIALQATLINEVIPRKASAVPQPCIDSAPCARRSIKIPDIIPFQRFNASIMDSRTKLLKQYACNELSVRQEDDVMYIDIVGQENGVVSLTEEVMMLAASLLDPAEPGPGAMYNLSGIALYKLSEDNRAYSCFQGRFVHRLVAGDRTRMMWLTILPLSDLLEKRKAKFYSFLIGKFQGIKLSSISRNCRCFISVKSSCPEPHVYVQSVFLENARLGLQALESRIEMILRSLKQDESYNYHEQSQHHARSSSFHQHDFRVPFRRRRGY